MDYRKYQDKYLVRIDPGEEVLSSILEIVKKEQIHAGDLRALGASDDYEVCVYDLKEKKYYGSECHVQSEITSLFGTISEKGGEPYLHVHMQAMTKEGKAVGGHLKRCVISGTMEMVIEKMDLTVGRQVNPRTGLNDLKF